LATYRQARVSLASPPAVALAFHHVRVCQVADHLAESAMAWASET